MTWVMGSIYTASMSDLDTAAKLKRLVSRAVRQALDMEVQMKAWVSERRGVWVVGWYEGKRRRQKACGEGSAGKALAQKFQRQIDAELVLGQTALSSNKTWAQFRQEYEDRILSGTSPDHIRQARMAYGNFERIINPGKLDQITTATLDLFTSKRRQDKHRGRRRGAAISPATVNADLRQIKAALKVAVEWGYLKSMPKFRMERELTKLPRFVTVEHFDLIYAACEKAYLPDVRGIDPPAWWRGLLTFLYLTGWRIGETLAMKRADVDLKVGAARIAAEDTKGRREERIELHPHLIAHLEQLGGFWDHQFHWPLDVSTLRTHRQMICQAAGVPAYTFHDFRRAFGTVNAPHLPPRVLQHLMRHRSGQTTQKFYQNPTGMGDVMGKLVVPPSVSNAPPLAGQKDAG